MKKLLTKIFASLAVLMAVLPINDVFADEREFEGETVKVAVVGDEYAEIWDYVSQKVEKEEGINLEVEMLTDYVIPNEALSDGSVDLNAFQHDEFLENWNNENDGDLVTLAYTVSVPLRLYSDKYESIDDLPEGAKIACNNAPTSLSYNLQMLERVGLIKLDEEAVLPTPSDIVENPKNIEIIELDAAQIPAAVADVDAAFIDNSFLGGTDFQPSDAIYVYGDTPETINLKRVNNIACRSEDKDNPLYLKIVELFQQDDVAQKIDEVTNGGSIAAWDIMKEAQGE